MSAYSTNDLSNVDEFHSDYRIFFVIDDSGSVSLILHGLVSINEYVSLIADGAALE